MKRVQFLSRMKAGAMASIALGLLLLYSCADHYDGKESWSSSVRNTTLASPSASSISVAKSSDGSSWIITWPVVYGAGGYEYSLYDVSDPSNPVVVDSTENAIVDGCSVELARAEDTNYKFVIRTLGNEGLNNAAAAESTEITFSSFTATFATIPSGTDLYEYFNENPLPADSAGVELCIDLESGGTYTISKTVDFVGSWVTLRCTNKNDRPTITLGEGASISTSAGMTLKNLILDCSASASAVIAMSKTPVDTIMNAAGGSNSYYDILNPVYLTNCDFEGVSGNFVYDNNVKYCLSSLIIDKCKVHLTSAGDAISGQAIFYFKAGFANTLTVKNSSFWNTGSSDAKYFVQYNNSARCDRAGYAYNYINYISNTFYNVAKAGQWGNYSGFSGRATSQWTVTKNIWVDCGSAQIARRILGGRTASTYTNGCTFNYNTYWFGGAAETGNETYDASGTQLATDPALKDPANGDLTPGGSEQLSNQTGDPRWLAE